MKNNLFYLLFSFAFYMQGQTEVIQNLQVEKDVTYLAYDEEITLRKFDLSNSIDLFDENSIIKNILCEIIEPTPRGDSLIVSINIEKEILKSSTYITAESLFFIENSTVYFNFRRLDYLENRNLKLTAFNHEGQVIQTLTKNLN